MGGAWREERPGARSGARSGEAAVAHDPHPYVDGRQAVARAGVGGEWGEALG